MLFFCHLWSPAFLFQVANCYVSSSACFLPISRMFRCLLFTSAPFSVWSYFSVAESTTLLCSKFVCSYDTSSVLCSEPKLSQNIGSVCLRKVGFVPQPSDHACTILSPRIFKWKKLSCSGKSPSLCKMEIIMLWLKATVLPVWNVNQCALHAAHVLWHDLHLSLSWDIVFRHLVSFASLGINNSAALNNFITYYYALMLMNYVISMPLFVIVPH